MAKFRKKPVLIEAMQVPPVGSIDDRLALDDWLLEKKKDRKCKYRGSDVLIETLEGVMTANVGDYIICGVQGELYPCKPDIFSATYDPE